MMSRYKHAKMADTLQILSTTCATTVVVAAPVAALFGHLTFELLPADDEATGEFGTWECQHEASRKTAQVEIEIKEEDSANADELDGPPRRPQHSASPIPTHNTRATSSCKVKLTNSLLNSCMDERVLCFTHEKWKDVTCYMMRRPDYMVVAYGVENRLVSTAVVALKKEYFTTLVNSMETKGSQPRADFKTLKQAVESQSALRVMLAKSDRKSFYNQMGVDKDPSAKPAGARGGFAEAAMAACSGIGSVMGAATQLL